MNDLFTSDQTPSEETLRDQLTAKWTEKFPTADPELIKSKVESDLYIKTIESQKDELRADYMKAQEEIQKSKALEQLIDRLNNKEVPAGTTPAVQNTPPSVAMNDIEKMFDDKYEAKKRSEVETSNFNKVQAKLQERFGARAGEVLAEQSNTLGLSKEDVNSLAKKSPDAFFRMLGLNTQEKDLFMAPPRSDLRNDNYAPKTVKRTWSWYQAEKAKNSKWYWNPQTQLQMHRDSEALGSAFEDGDFQ